MALTAHQPHLVMHVTALTIFNMIAFGGEMPFLLKPRKVLLNSVISGGIYLQVPEYDFFNWKNFPNFVKMVPVCLL